MTFGERVKKARAQLGLSQEKFAAKLGVSFSSVNRWEKGHFQPGYLAQAQFETFCRENGIEFDDETGAEDK